MYPQLGIDLLAVLSHSTRSALPVRLARRLRTAALVRDTAPACWCDLADVQALLGHKIPKTTARYGDVSREKLRKIDGWYEMEHVVAA